MAVAGFPSSCSSYVLSAYMADFPSRDITGTGTGSSYAFNPFEIEAFDLSEYLSVNDISAAPPAPPPEGLVAAPLDGGIAAAGANAGSSSSGSSSSSRKSGSSSTEIGKTGDQVHRVAFRTKSEVDVLDDGFKWRKYGKKSVKDNSNPRNYYRCSTDGCTVKKRVEKDREDSSYVITSYEGVHNHPSPGVVYYTTQDAASGHYLIAGCQIRPSS